MNTAQARHFMDMDINIRMAENGVIVRYDDPEIRAKNRKDEGEWQDPSVELVFKSMKEAMPDVQRLLRKLSGEETSEDEYSSAFDEASSDE